MIGNFQRLAGEVGKSVAYFKMVAFRESWTSVCFCVLLPGELTKYAVLEGIGHGLTKLTSSAQANRRFLDENQPKSFTTMNTASKLGPHTQTDRGTCPAGVGL
jgi:hypothetical protein